MAQRSNQRQPVYSADTLALRYLAGLVLIALGVMMFLAVEMRMAGNVFTLLRQVCCGLTGGLAVIAPVFPVWAGVLVIWSAQRKAPVRPFLFGMLAFFGLCAFIVLVTRIGNEEYLARLSESSDGSWGGVILQGYLQSAQLRASGGALGVLLAYPFWELVGTVLGAVIAFLLTACCVLLIFGLTPGRIRDLATGKVVLRWGRRPKDQAEQDQRQIAFQQEQEKQAYERQQAWLLQQEQARQAAAGAQGSGIWQRQAGVGPAENWQQHRGWTQPQPAQDGRMGANASGGNQDVSEWQQQLTDQYAAAGLQGKSRIFNREEKASPAESGRQSVLFGPRQEGRKTGGRFSLRREKDDGLSDLSMEEKRAAFARPDANQTGKQSRIRRTASGAEIGETGTRWNVADGEEKVQQVFADAERENRAGRLWQEEPGSAPAPGAETGRTEAADERLGAAARREAEAGPAPSGSRKAAKASREEEDRKKRTDVPWMQQVTEKMEAGEGTRPGAEAADRKTGEAKASREMKEVPEAGETPPAIRIPVVQETIQNPTWKPELKGVETREPEEEYWEPTPYYPPLITDLQKPTVSMQDTRQEDAERSTRLEAILADFRVQARVVNVTHGPAISRFEMELAPGTKVAKVSELGKDIAYGMQATSVRIEAPIPGKSLVGVEVPNPKRATVTLREILESPQMQNAKSILTVALGKDIAGTPVVCDLAKMPHMLIAGATGSGKSVCINTIINSLLFRAGPDEVKMILVDPKVVELQCYNGIPHLLLPVVSDPHKAAAALAWAVAEMMERYDKFAERGVRNLDGYNSILEAGEKPMARIVIIIDELADLMMVCKKDVEEYICRLTQLARAAGIHLIVATQRPSVDVITGLIKANIPSRIAFKTAQSVDSRTILDRNGSEQLLGMGDMLYLPTGSFAPIRIQGCFLSDQEVNQVAERVRAANPSSYDPNILDKLEELSRGAEEAPSRDMVGGPADNPSGDAELFAQAVEMAIQDGQVSTSTLQRRLKVGYSRAGRLTDEMEARGIISAKDGSKPRKCLITREEWLSLQASENGLG